MVRTALVAAALSLVCAAPALAKEKGAAANANMTGQREHQMANCPSAVRGATTTVVNRKDGVEVLVTAKDPQAQQEIRRRARVQQTVAWQPERGAIEHTGGGTGSGKFGYCPGLVQNTRLDIADTPDGAKLTVHAASVEDVPRLQTQTKERAQSLKK